MHKKKLQLWFFAVFTAGISVLLFLIFKPYLGVVFIAGVLAVVFYPVYEKLKGEFNQRKNLAALATTFLILVFIIVPVIVASAFLLKEAVDIYNSISFGQGPQNLIAEAGEYAENLISAIFPGVSVYTFDFESYARDILDWIIGNFDSIFAAIFNSVFKFILMLICLFYFFLFGSKIKESLSFWSPMPDKYDEEFMQTLRASINAVLRGRILVSVVQGVFLGVGFDIFGIGSPVLWGFVGAVASLIPILGTSIITVPAVAYLFFTGHTGAGIGLFVWGVVAVGLIDNVVSAFLLKDKIKVHPIIILFSILGGVQLFGAIGFLVGPMVVSAFLALTKIYPFIVQHRDESGL